MPDRRVKPCATCRHPKTRHRRGYCIHHWTTRGQMTDTWTCSLPDATGHPCGTRGLRGLTPGAAA